MDLPELHETAPRPRTRVVIAEDALVLGLSVVSGAHPDEDVAVVRAMGADAVFTPGAGIAGIVAEVNRLSTDAILVESS